MKLTLCLVRCLSAEQHNSAYTPAVQMWATLSLFSGFNSSLQSLSMSSSTSRLACDTDLSSAVCLTPSAAGFMIQRRSAKLGSVSDAWEAGSRRPLCTSSSSVRLPDRIQDLHHLLIDDENYGHIQTHTAQPRNCPFIETTDGHKEREG